MDKIIIEYVKIGDLKPYEGNPRKIDDTEMKKLRKSLADFGFVDPVIARKSDNMVIGGHMRLLAAKHEGYETVPVVYTEFEDSKAAMLNIALNKISGEFDWPKLGDLFQEFDDGEFDLEMSGFSTEETERLMNGLDTSGNPEDEWQDMPEFSQEDKTAFRSIIVHMEDEEAVDLFQKVTRAKITDKTKMVWYPELENANIKEKNYE